MTSTTVITPPAPTLFVLSAEEPADVLDFYAQLCGWRLEASSAAGMQRGAGAGAQSFLVRKGPVGWLPFLSVTDLAGVLERAAAAGGRVIHPLPDDHTGRSAAVFDPSGARLGLWEVDSLQPPAETPILGRVVWLEEKTRDQQAAVAFHHDVFGFEAVGGTGPGKVQLLRAANGSAYSGVMQFDDRWSADHPPHWLIYVSVENVPAAIERALAAGGSVWFEPTDTPLGVLAYVRDPGGNAIAVVEVAEAAHGMLFGAPTL